MTCEPETEEVRDEHGKRERKNILILLCFIVAAVFLCGGGYYAWHQGRIVNERLCQTGKQSREALRFVIIYVRDRSLALSDDEQRDKRIKEFYAPLLRQIPEIKCIDGKPITERRADVQESSK